MVSEMDYDPKDVKKFTEFISNEYLAEVLVDNLPGVMKVVTSDNYTYFGHGYPVGGALVHFGNSSVVGYALNNHLDFKIFYNNKEVKDSILIVGFEVTPRSVRYSSKEEVSSMCGMQKVPSMSIQGKGSKVENDVHLSTPPQA